MRAALLIAIVLSVRVAGATDWPAYGGGPRRLFFNPAETTITASNVAALRIKWTVPTGAVVTASPSIVTLPLPVEGPVAVAFVPSWDGHLYALRVRDGSLLWRFTMADQPGASYPSAASSDVEMVDGRPRIFVAGGETVYAIDAVTGREVWHFDAGTGCGTGLCGFTGETNEVESSPVVAGGMVLFGMDLNENGIQGKGGFYGVDVHDGHLLWYFDLESGGTCHTLPGDDVRRFDGYHSETELGLPAGFLASRPGCDFDRTGHGCGGVWSSAAVDVGRALLYFGSSACIESPNALPYQEAIVALHLDGTPAWRWKPRPVDNDDRDFGGAPNLFAITAGGTSHDVVGQGGKDGTYYVFDRDGVNALDGVRWDDADASGLPYWRTNVVPGGDTGGIIGAAAVDESARRIYFSTAPGDDLGNPQRPTVHALDADTGAIVWQNVAEPDADASFAPTTAIPGVVFTGKNLGGALRAYDAATGTKLASVTVGFTLAATPAVVDGTAIVGAGAGERGGNPSDPAAIAAAIPQNVTALCVAGTPGCDPSPADACDAGGSAPGDAQALQATRGAIDAACPCAIYDGTLGRRHADYLRCARRVVSDAIDGDTLRAACLARIRRDVATSTCGRPAKVVCCQTAPHTRCLVANAQTCTSSGRRTRTICANATSCAATSCEATGICVAGQ